MKKQQNWLVSAAAREGFARNIPESWSDMLIFQNRTAVMWSLDANNWHQT
jgi:hypothetical protein